MRVPGNLELDDISKDGRVLIAHHTLTQTVRGASAADPKPRDLSWLDASVAADLSDDGKTLLITESGRGQRVPPDHLHSRDGWLPGGEARGGRGACALSGRKVGPGIDSARPGQRPKASSFFRPGPGEARVLDRGGLAEFGWGAWLPDGRSVVFSAAPPGGASRIWIQAVPEGKPRPIGPEGARMQPQWSPISPDGRYRGRGPRRYLPANSARRRGGAAGGSRRGSEERPRDPVDERRARALSCASSASAPIKVWLLDLETGQRRLWKEIDDEQPFGYQYVRVTPDASAWVYSAGHVLSELYLVEGLR